jgi:hypothetical protein
MKAALLLFAIVLVSSSYIQVAQAQSACATCELVVGTIEGWVENNATEAQIEQYLQNLCNNVQEFSQIVSYTLTHQMDSFSFLISATSLLIMDWDGLSPTSKTMETLKLFALC